MYSVQLNVDIVGGICRGRDGRTGVRLFYKISFLDLRKGFGATASMK
jgi:hypothetical protein